ncbi:MAG: metalloenzyme [Planctomycetes bacterium]|nr:metalloenzyme [Planctomycetota bacterium]
MGIFGGLFGKKEEPKKALPPKALPPKAGTLIRPAPKGKNNYIIITLDSCRFDSFMAAKPKVMTKLGPVEKRYSYASWTAPSHYNLLMGLVPHTSPPNVFASEYYKHDFLNYNRRFGTDGMEFGKLVPSLFMPTYLRRELGYFVHGRVSLPVLNPSTCINRDFDSFQLMDKHNDMAAMLPTMKFSDERPSFFLLNVGETHYPFALPTEDSNKFPRISGINGVLKGLDKEVVEGKLVHKNDSFFVQSEMDELRQRQINTVEYIDTVMEKLFDICPKNTFITITADHGELFGEEGYFGHGPIMHPKVHEVPFVEGQLR